MKRSETVEDLIVWARAYDRKCRAERTAKVREMEQVLSEFRFIHQNKEVIQKLLNTWFIRKNYVLINRELTPVWVLFVCAECGAPLTKKCYCPICEVNEMSRLGVSMHTKNMGCG